MQVFPQKEILISDATCLNRVVREQQEKEHKEKEMKDEEENKKKECFKGHELQQRTT